MMKALAACSGALLLALVGARAETPPSPQHPAGVFSGRFDAIAHVKVQQISHTLRPSDVRRIEQGAPPPLIPYKVLMLVKQSAPETGLHRLIFDGLTTATWMPDQESTGILLLVSEGGEFYPADNFPTGNFLPERVVEGQRLVNFPPEKGVPVPFTLAWDCLCDLLNTRKTPASPERIETYTRFLLDGGPDKMATGLFFLVHVSGAGLPWTALGRRLSLSGKSHLETLPLASVVDMLAIYAQPEQASPALEMVLTVLPGQGAQIDWEQKARACLELAARATEAEQAFLLENVLTREYDLPGGKQALVQDLAPAEAVLARLEGEANTALLTRMLREPARFPALRNAETLGAFWKLLDGRKHPGLPAYLQVFLQQPYAALPGIHLTEAEVQKLVQIAGKMGASAKAANPL